MSTNKGIKVRILESEIKDYGNSQKYQTLYISFLIDRYPFSKTSTYLEIAFDLKFQRNIFDDGTKSHWYAMNYLIDTDKIRDIKYMLKISNKISKINHTTYDIQPEHILTELKAVEYFNFHGQYIPLSYGERKAYHIYSKSSLYMTIYVTNDKDLNKQFTKAIQDNNLTDARYEFYTNVPIREPFLKKASQETIIDKY